MNCSRSRPGGALRRAALLAAVPLLALAAPAAAQPPAALPYELHRFPGDSFLFAHVRAADVWNGPIAQDVRKALGKDFAELEKKATDEIGLKPEDFETATFCFPALQGPGDESRILFLLTTTKPYDREKVKKAVLAQIGDRKLPEAKNPDVVMVEEKHALLFAGPRTLVFGEIGLVDDFIGKKPVKDGPLTEAIKLAAAGKHTGVLAINPDKLPAEAKGNLPREAEPFKPLIESKVALILGDLKNDVRAEFRFTCENAEKAKEAERALKILKELVQVPIGEGIKELGRDKKNAEFVALLKGLSEAFKAVQTSQKDTTAVAVLHYKDDLPFGRIAVQAVKEMRGAAERAASTNNLKQIALAMHNYHDSTGALPPAAICDRKGKRLLSWRVAILPYIEQDNLYKQFRLDEPWDSEHNKKLVAQMPKVYAVPSVNKPGSTDTHYQAFVGNGAMFDWIQATRFADVTDGLSNTVMVGEAEKAVPWTKPDDLEFDPAKPLPKLGFFHKDRTTFAFGDGSVRLLTKGAVEKVLKSLVTRNGGEVVAVEYDE